MVSKADNTSNKTSTVTSILNIHC